jgi:hypothetical protein
MKKFLFAFVAGCMSALALTNGACAQSTNNTYAVETPENVIKTEKSGTPVKDDIVNLDAVNAKAFKDFRKSYKNVSNEKWFKVSDGFTADFTVNGISNKIYYNKKGQWIASLKTYREDKFSPDIRDIVKRRFYDYQINYVQEVETLDTYGTPTYIVHLEDNNNIKLARIEDGEMDIYEEFKKQ